MFREVSYYWELKKYPLRPSERNIFCWVKHFLRNFCYLWDFHRPSSSYWFLSNTMIPFYNWKKPLRHCSISQFPKIVNDIKFIINCFKINTREFDKIGSKRFNEIKPEMFLNSKTCHLYSILNISGIKLA